MENNLSESQIAPEKFVPWEQRKEIGLVKSFLFTFKKVIFRPKTFFSQAVFKEGAKGPVLFGAIVLLVVILSHSLFFFLLPIVPPGKYILFKKLLTSPVFLLMSPLISLTGLFVSAIIFHIGIWLMGARKGFLATLRVVGYSAAPFIISLVPVFLGLLPLLFIKVRLPIINMIILFISIIGIMVSRLLAEVWPLVVLNIGFEYLHKISFVRAIGGTIISSILGVVLSIIVGFTIIPYFFPSGLEICGVRKGEPGLSPIGIGWKTQTVDTKGDVGTYSAIVVDDNGGVHITYADHTNDNLKYAFYNGKAWQIQVVDKDKCDEGTWTGPSSIAIDKNRNPHIGYCRKYKITQGESSWRLEDRLKYGYKEDSQWKTEIIDNEVDCGWGASIVLDGKGLPHISYVAKDSANYVIKYMLWAGSKWESLIVDRDIIHKGKYGWNPRIETSLALDYQDNPHIAYFDQNSLELKHAMWNGTTWIIQTVDKVELPEDKRAAKDLTPSMVLDKRGNPRILYEMTHYESPLKTELRLASWTGSEWQIQTIDTKVFIGMAGRAFSLRLDKEGFPHVAYIGTRDPGGWNCYWDLKYAHWTGTKWDIEIVEAQKAGWSAKYTGSVSMSLDKNDKPHISYFDVNKLDLKYAYKI